VKNDRLLDEDEEPNGSLLALPPQPPKVCEDLALPLLDVKKRAPDPPPNSDRPLDVRALCEPAEKARLKPPPNARLPPLYMLMSSPPLCADLINSPPALVFLFSFPLSTIHFTFTKHLRNILVFPKSRASRMVGWLQLPGWGMSLMGVGQRPDVAVVVDEGEAMFEHRGRHVVEIVAEIEHVVGEVVGSWDMSVHGSA
jgi:hypothetical protein